MQLFQTIYFQNALHVSGGSSAHHREHVCTVSCISLVITVIKMTVIYVCGEHHRLCVCPSDVILTKIYEVFNWQ